MWDDMAGQNDIARRFEALIAALNRARWTDGEVASVLGITRENAWLARERLGLPAVVRGRSLSRFRRTCQRRFEASFERLNGHEPADPRTPLRALVAREEVSRLRGRLATMSPRTREVVSLRFEGRSLSEIGRRLNLSRERVRQIWIRAKRRLAVRAWPRLAEGGAKE